MVTSGALKIGITCYPLIGGSGILATALGSELARRGNEVHFFSSAKPVRLDLSQPGIFFHEVVVNEYSLFKYPDYTLPLAVKMAGIGRARQLDIFHVHYAVPHATAAWLAVQMLGGPGPGVPRIITTLHGTDTTLLGQDPNYREAIEHSLAQSDAITAVSENLRQETLRTFHLDRPVEVVPNFFVPAADLRSRAEVRAELGMADSDFLIVHTSNLRPLKRIDLLLRVFAATRSPRQMRLLILAGESFTPYEPLLDELEVRSRVLVKENVLDVEDYLAAADAGLYTSETESFGLSILETLFHAKPVVAFRVGGIPEVVSDGETGFLHRFGDTSAMAASLDQLADSPQRAGTMGQLGQKHAAEKFSAELVVPRYQAIYERLVKQALTPAPTGVKPSTINFFTMTNTYVPMISSGTAGPLGVVHLPRLWQKVSLEAAGKLAAGYPGIGKGFDAMTCAALGLDEHAVKDYIKQNKPTYPEFEAWVKKNAKSLTSEAVEKHNAAVRGYNHDDATRQGITSACGIPDASAPKDAVNLNNLDDWYEFHKAVLK